MPTRYDPYSDPYSDRIAELLRARGEIAARQAAESGDIWGRGIQNIAGTLAQGIGGYAQAREEERKAEEMSKRDAAWTSYIETGEWQKDPNKAYAIARKMWGPDAGKQMAGLEAVSKLASENRPKDNPEEDRKSLGAMATALRGMGDPAVARLYPSIRALMLKNYPGVELPEQYDPSLREQLIKPIAEAYGTAKKDEGFTLSKGQVRYGPEGQVIAQGPAEAPESYTLGEGQVRYGPNGEVIARGPAKPAGSSWSAPFTGPDGVSYQRNEMSGEIRPTPGVGTKPPESTKPPTEGETKAAGFYERAQKAEDVVKKLEAEGKGKPGFWESWTPDKMLPDDRRQYLQAQRDFTISHLRPESGAAISKEEYAEDAKTYFPQHGDSQAVIDQKAAARKTILDSLKAQGGRAAQGAGPQQVTSKAQFDALPSGTEFIAPDGTRRRKP